MRAGSEPGAWPQSARKGHSVSSPTKTSPESCAAPRPQATRSRFGRFGVALAVGALALGVGTSAQFRGILADSLTRQPAQFSELFFDDQANLPKVLDAGRPSHFSFVVANHEGHPVDYGFVVTAAEASGTTTVKEGRVSLNDGDRAVTDIAFAPDRPDTSYLLTVRLVGRRESIHFLGRS